MDAAPKQAVVGGTPAGWQRPTDVMRRFQVHRVRAKALQNRITQPIQKKPPSKSLIPKPLESSNKRPRFDDDDDSKPSEDVMTTQNGSIPVDWKLRTRARFLSEKPLPSFNKMKPSEQASGVSGFVRCMSNERLDSGASARFHECCLVWQSPWLPWLELCPRPPASAISALSATHKDALHRAWTDSLYSVFQLVRAQQCPYFYILGDSFTCLFRASGVCGQSETNAAMVPTTRGLRKKLQAEEILFTMPLRRDEEAVSKKEGEEKKEEELGEGEEEGDDAEEWLQSMGVAEEEVKRLRSMDDDDEARKLGKDGGQDSLVYVEGIKAQALFNWLLNCKAVTVGSGVPPTILSPVAFLGATLKPLSVRTGQVGGFSSVEVRGPLLPNAIHALCRLLSTIVPEFAATFATLDATSAFALMDNSNQNTNKSETDVEDPQAAFNRVNLRDCGLTPDILPSFCTTSNVHTFDSLKYSEEKFSWVSDAKS